MDEIADNTFTELHTAEEPSDDPSLLTLILELTPGGWYNIKNETSLLDVVKSLLVFLNAHLSLNNSNQVSFILSTPGGCKFLYPNPQTDYDELRLRPPVAEEDGVNNGVEEMPSLIGKGMYRQFRIVDDIVLEQLNNSLQQTMEATPAHVSSKLSGAISLALTYTNRMLKLDLSVSTTTASAMSAATNISNKESAASSVGGAGGSGAVSSGGAGGAGGYIGTSRIKSRILIVTPNDNEDIKYISLMNGIFAAQKMKVPIDVAKLGKKDSSYLQQASDATNGVYLHIERPFGFIQVLSTAYFIDPSIRSLIILPTSSNINYRASCFITGKSVEIGYVCSVCLCIMSIIPDSNNCPTCNSAFDKNLVAKLKKKPTIKRRKVEKTESPAPDIGLGNGNGHA